MTDLQWQGDGPDLAIDVAGRRWRLKLDDRRPGLSWSDGRGVARRLCLEHVSTIGRQDDGAFDGPSLVSFERHRGRIQATFAPPGWHGLSVRATWELTPDLDGFDLQVQVSVTTSAAFRRLEVAIGSFWSEAPESSPPDLDYRAEPRDAQAAALSYDGRDPSGRLERLTTLPIPSSSPHILRPQLGREAVGIAGERYVEMVQPNDCARRIVGERNPGAAPMHGAWSIRHGLFGHDLEKGVVLRGRIRGIWLDSDASADDVRRLHQVFLREPPALGP